MVLTRVDLDEIKKIIEQAQNAFKEQVLQSISDNISSIIDERYGTFINEQKSNIITLKNEVLELKEENASLKKHIDNYEQYSRNLNVRIFGVPLQEGENVSEVMQDIFKKNLKINIKNSDIKKCYRVNAKTPRADKPPAILLCFNDDAARQLVLKNRKMLKSTGIVIKEDLTKRRLALMDNAVKKFTIKNVWCLNGNIFVKCKGAVHRLAGDSDINNISA